LQRLGFAPHGRNAAIELVDPGLIAVATRLGFFGSARPLVFLDVAQDGADLLPGVADLALDALSIGGA
jgi:hypothetical protein